MDYSSLEKKLQSFNGAYKEFPFGDDAAVFKVLGKMFALVAWKDNPLRITLKCDPGEADMLRSQYDVIKPGYYMNKNHWNTITLDDSIPEDLLIDMIDSSYDLVVKGLRKADREKLNNNYLVRKFEQHTILGYHVLNQTVRNNCPTHLSAPFGLKSVALGLHLKMAYQSYFFDAKNVNPGRDLNFELTLL